jgi:antitoxin component of RelBE/YafQ-DinJ toxin-antitoxin module
MNITLAIDEQVADAARKSAQAMGKSLNQAVREYLEQLAGQSSLQADLEQLRRLSQKPTGKRGTDRFDRDALHARGRR